MSSRSALGGRVRPGAVSREWPRNLQLADVQNARNFEALQPSHWACGQR